MTATTLEYRRPSPAPLLWLAILGLVLAVAVALSEHATIKHGSEADAVRQCLNDNGHLQLWENLETGRFIRLCEMPDGRWGLQIIQKVDGKWREVTSYIKNKMHDLRQVEQYLENRGSVKLWPK